MSNDFIIEVSQQAIKVALMLAAPMLIGAMVVGIVVSLFQAVTQINEQTLAFIPKIVAIMLLIIVSGPWLLETMTNYTEEMFTSIPEVIKKND